MSVERNHSPNFTKIGDSIFQSLSINDGRTDTGIPQYVPSRKNQFPLRQIRNCDIEI